MSYLLTYFLMFSSKISVKFGATTELLCNTNKIIYIYFHHISIQTIDIARQISFRAALILKMMF